MKKICMITTVSITMVPFVVETAKYLHEKCGYDITLICNDDDAFSSSLPEYLHFIPVRMARGIDFSGFKSVLEFIKIFRREKFDLVQYATPNAACYASIAATICRVPIRLYCQWGIRYVGLSGLSRFIFKFIEKMSCVLSTDVRAVSKMNKAYAVSEGLYKPDKAVVLGNGGTIGVDMQQYNIHKKEEYRKQIRNLYNIYENEFVFGFSGRISADKGCRELLVSFREIEKKYGNAKLLMLGDFEAKHGLPEDLIDWAENSPNIILPGRIANHEVVKYYSALDVLVHPTYREGFGMVLQEAGALGLGIITTKIPGASEVMEDGVSCILVKPKDETELLNAMLMLLDGPDKIREIGMAAFERTQKFYDRNVMLENQRQDYVKLLSK